MIKLDTAFVTSVTNTMGGQSQSTVTDTLFVSSVRIDFTTGAIYALILRGTGTPFVANMEPLDICVNPDGSFTTADGSTWTGNVASAPQLVAALKEQFDGFILASGKVSGTTV
jgi:hypothetical protein